MGTGPGTVKCHICFPRRLEGEKRSARVDEVEEVIVDFSKPEGGLYGAETGAAEGGC